MRKMTILVAALAVAAIGLAADAQANCVPSKTAATFGNDGPYVYWTVSNANEATLTGKFWQQGNFNAGNNGTLTGFLYFSGAGVNMNAILGDSAVAGCPSTRLITVAEVQTLSGGAAFLAATVDEVSGPAVDFAYQNLGDLAMVAMPRLNLTGSSRSGTGVVLNFNNPAVGGLYGPGAATALQAIRVVSATGTADPGRSAASYTTVQDFATTSGAAAGSVTVDCSNTAVDRFVAVQLVFDQNQVSSLVGPSVRVECDPTMADPNRDFKLIEGPKDKPRPARER